MKYSFILFGILFGFILSRAGATTFDNYINLFLFRDLQLLWVIGAAVVVAGTGVQLLKLARARALFSGQPLTFVGKPMTRDLWLGAILFGVGWGMTGSCPGSAVAMLGEGKLAVLATIGGIFFGTYLFAWRDHRRGKSTPCNRSF